MTLIETIAKTCHEVNRVYCQSLGDLSQPSWKDAPEWQKQSARNGVLFHLTRPGVGPEGSHENWLREKLDQGWTYGPVKDAEAKTHPCCVPYDELPEEQKVKDKLFVAIVESLK
jgi:hypothetical protein